MRYCVKWRLSDEGSRAPEICDSEDHAKLRARELIQQYSDRLIIDIWNEDETWQIVASPGVAEWCQSGT